MRVGTIKPRFFPKRQILRRPILGDMRHLINIQTRNLVPTDPENIDFDETFVTTNTVWAFLETKKGDSIFDGTNITKSLDTIFVIRFIFDIFNAFKSNLNSEYWIDYNGDRYNINSVESYDGRQQFMKLVCNQRGDDTLPVNKA